MKEKNNEAKGYKLSPLGQIPDDWEVKQIGEFAKLFSGGTPSTSMQEYYNGNIPFIKSGEIYFDQTDQRITDEALKNSSAKMVNKGDILYALYGANSGEVAISKLNGAINQAILCIRHNQDCDKLFLYSFLLSRKESIVRSYLQGGQGNLSADIVKSIPIVFPPLKEQTAIANLLSTWDNAINILTQLIAQKELRKKWLMQKLLTGKKRLKGFEGEWGEVKLSHLFERVTRRNTEANTNVVTISAQRGFIRQDDYFNKTVASDITDNYFLVERGEFCYNKSYSNGYPWGATKRLNDFNKAVVTTLYICFGIKDKTTTSGDFFEQYFESGSLEKGLMKIAHEGGRAHGLLNVTPSDFFEIKILIPEFKEQQAIANVLQTATNEVNILQKRLKNIKEQKKGLMQVLLSGKKRLKV